MENRKESTHRLGIGIQGFHSLHVYWAARSEELSSLHALVIKTTYIYIYRNRFVFFFFFGLSSSLMDEPQRSSEPTRGVSVVVGYQQVRNTRSGSWPCQNISLYLSLVTLLLMIIRIALL